MTRVQNVIASRSSSPAGRGAVARSERTRAAIREAANGLFLKKGVDATTVDAICAAAGVSKGTFYLYFHRKEVCSSSTGSSGCGASGRCCRS